MWTLAVLNLINSLGIGSGALVVMFLSALMAFPVYRVNARPLRYIAAVAIAFFVAFVFYWLPVFLGADASEFSGWSFIVVPVWFVAGAFSAAAVTRILEGRSVSQHPKHS